MKVTIIVLLCIFVFCGVGSGEIYKWMDEKGTVHFTEDPSTIPEKYRGSVKSRTTEEDRMSPDERIREKEKLEEEADKRRERDRIEYEESIRDEERKRNVRQLEDAAEEERIRTEKEEKARRAEESKKEPLPEYVKDQCLRCGGSGIIWKTLRTPKKACPNCPTFWKEEKIATKCPDCNGKGFTLRRVR